MSKRASAGGGIFLLALGSLVWLWQASPEVSERRKHEDAGKTLSGPTFNTGSEPPIPFRRGWFPSQPTEEEYEADERLAIRADPEPGEATSEWTQLPKSERIAQLRAGFDQAIEDLEAGNPAGHARAVDALSALRFELYETPEGRAEHAEYELKLETVMEKD